MNKAIGYVRVSTEKQAESGLSLESQIEKIRAMATVKDVELLDVVVEAESAKDLNRPGVQRVMQLVKSRAVGMVIIAKLDRLSRSVRDTCDLIDLFEKKGVALVSLAESLDTGSAMGRCIISVCAAFSQMEREVIGERTSAALQQRVQRGERAGTVPYGFRVNEGGRRSHNGKLIDLLPDPGEQEMIEWIKGRRAGGRSLRDIADELNGQGRRTRSGSPWRFQYIANILETK